MHPDLQEPVFAEWYGCDELVEAVTTILQCEEKDIQLGMYSPSNFVKEPEIGIDGLC